ncbi:MAG TPA: hypothetical protein PK167_08395 [Prolixibacteraceae bacterium]|nr:hypothetical protein [Prolixibacteraceae bacterium]
MSKIFDLKCLLLLAVIFLSGTSCGENNEPELPPVDPRNDLVVKTEIVNPAFTGNGVQWGGYDLLQIWTGSPTLSPSDWDKLFLRVRFMRPPLVRIMVSAGWNYLSNGQFDPAKSEPVLLKILDFCQQEEIAVMFGEWGHQGGTGIDQEWLENSASFIEWLINVKGYSCIKYFNMVNEPNGNWSSINGNYPLWKQLIEQFHHKLTEKGIASKVKLIGPDVAVWGTDLVHWVSNTAAELDNKIGAYDIHTYPKETEVRDGSYQKMITAYRKAAPSSKEMLMGELGFKYDSSSELGKQNAQRIANDKYASDDSNMSVYDAFYGIDMADAVIQNMRAGYGGVILWDLDDAMYNKGPNGATTLKRWGFWNILGAEKFENPNDENIRPWFYTMSLMCRYFPEGTKIRQVALPDKVGLRAIAGEKDGKYTIAIVNSHTVSYSVNLRMENGTALASARTYRYQSGKGAAFTGATDTNGFAQPVTTNETIDLQENKLKQLDIPRQSFCLITNMD